MASYCLDIETFISEVKKYPEIWDMNCDEYKNRLKKQKAWAQVAMVFITEFEDMSYKEKLEVFRKLHGKWRNIRDSYVRAIRRKDSKKTYMYARQLSFMETVYPPTASDSDGDWPSDTDEPLKVTFNKKEPWASDEDSTSVIDNLKRKRVMKDTSIEYVAAEYPDAACSYSVEDEDRAFFESLLPAVREFNTDQKLELRSEVITLIKSIRKQSLID